MFFRPGSVRPSVPFHRRFRYDPGMWQDREECVRNLLAARRDWKRRQATVAETRAAYRAAVAAARRAADRVETALSSLEAKQGYLPFSEPEGEPTAAGR